MAQASEKGWGAAALLVKAAAQRRGMNHKVHAPLFDVVHRLRQETREYDFVLLFDSTNQPHRHFHENWFDGEAASDRPDCVERFLNKVEPLL